LLLSKKDSDARFKILEQDGMYWQELRRRVVRTLSVVIIVSILAGLSYDRLWIALLAHIRALCPELKIVSRSVLGPASLTFILSGSVGLCVGLFWAGVEIWCFIRPALLLSEKRLIQYFSGSFLLLTMILQYICFVFVLPVTLKFFLAFNQSIVESSVDLYELATFALAIHQGMALVALWPYILLALIYSGWLSRGQLLENRNIVYVGSFIIGMLLTPPDVVSQCFVSIPLILMYESVLILLYFTKNTHHSRSLFYENDSSSDPSA